MHNTQLRLYCIELYCLFFVVFPSQLQYVDMTSLGFDLLTCSYVGRCFLCLDVRPRCHLVGVKAEQDSFGDGSKVSWYCAGHQLLVSCWISLLPILDRHPPSLAASLHVHHAKRRVDVLCLAKGHLGCVHLNTTSYIHTCMHADRITPHQR